MAYVDTLLASYKNANGGVEADAATKLAIDALATQVNLGKITEAQALTSTLAFTDDTTAVVLATYQFFQGWAPSEAGLAYFLNADAVEGLNNPDALYNTFNEGQGFNQESRFINFSINLALASSAAPGFAAAYGPTISYQQTVATAYNKIIGNDVAKAAGVDVDGAVAWLSRAENVAALTLFVKSNNPDFTDAQVELGVKAALIGEILNIAISQDLGGYAEAVNAAVKDLSDDGHYVADNADGVDLTTAYPAGPAVGQTFNLTTGTDTGAAFTGTAGADSFLADSGTFTAFDAIDGGTGADSLTVTEVTNAITTANRSVTNIETATLRSGGNTVTANTTGWTGLTTLNVTAATNGATITAAKTTAVNVGNVTGTGNVSVTGGSAVLVSDVTLTGNVSVTTAASSVKLTNVDVTGTVGVTDSTTAKNAVTSVALDAVDSIVTVTGNAVTSLSLANDADGVTLVNANTNGFTLNISLDDTVSAVTDQNGNAEAVNLTVVSDSELTLGAAGAEAITIAGEGVVELIEGAANLDAVETITVTGDAGVIVDLSTLGALVEFDGSATTGDITITDADATTAELVITTGSGDDSVTTTGALDADAVIHLNGGDDFYSASAAAAAGAEVDGGAGTDTLALANGTSVTDAYVNFEVLEVGGGTGTYDMSKLEGITAVTATATALSGAVVLTHVAAGTTLEFVAGDSANTDFVNGVTYTLDSATGTSDSVSITLTAVDGDDDGVADGNVTTGVLTAAGIETVNLVSHVSVLDVDKAATTGTDESTTAGDYTNVIDSLVVAAAKTINVSGDANLTITALTDTVLTKVDAHTMTGALNIDVSGATGAVEFLGGSGDDVVTVGGAGSTVNAGAGADSITIGAAGSADTLIFNAGDSIFGASDSIDGFVTTEDAIDLGAFGFTGQAASAIIAKGDISAAMATWDEDTSIANFFVAGNVQRGVAWSSDGTDTFVFVDTNHDGNFTTGTDLFITLTNVTTVALGDFGF